jgi:hypothetical protein
LRKGNWEGNWEGFMWLMIETRVEEMV